MNSPTNAKSDPCVRVSASGADVGPSLSGDDGSEEEVKMMRVLAFLRLGPRLFATFSNGIAFEAVAGVGLRYGHYQNLK